MTLDVASLAQAAMNLGLNLLGAVIILIVGWFVAGWVKRIIDRAITRNPKADRTLANVLARVARWAIVALTVVAVLGRFGVQTASIVALFGAAGLAVGLALQGTLSNLAAGLMLLTLRPFRIGDAVDIGGIGGSVNDLGLFVTRITTFDGVPVHIPNSGVWGKAIRNYSQASARRLDLTVGVGYGEDVGQALDLLRQLVVAEERVLSEPAPAYFIDALADSSVNLIARVWTRPADLFQLTWDLRREVKGRLDAAGISIPFPQRDVHIVQAEPAPGSNGQPEANAPGQPTA